MSEAAERWLALPLPLRRYGGSGRPHACVAHVACSHCKAKRGHPCKGSQGPTLGHHVARGTAYRYFKRFLPRPRHPSKHPPPSALLDPSIRQELLSTLERLVALVNRIP